MFKNTKSKKTTTDFIEKDTRVKELLDQMTEIIVEINQIVNSTKEATNEQEQISKSQATAMEELIITIKEFTKGTEEITSSIMELSQVISNTSQNGEEVKHKTDKMVKISEKGKASMKKNDNNVKSIMDSVSALSTTMLEVGKSTSEIKSIIQVIDNIAGQTNLLALNASIEAARAGENGRGFAVVAQEIRKLAEDVKTATKDIETLITEVDSTVQKAVSQSDINKEGMMQVKESVKETDEVFENLIISISEVQGQLNDIVNEVNSVNDLTQNIASITEEQLAGSEEILASSEDVGQMALNNLNYSKKLNEDTKKLFAAGNKSAKRIIKQMKDLAGSNGKVGYVFYRHNTEGIFEYVTESVKEVLSYSVEEFMKSFESFLTDNPINSKAIIYTENSIKGIQQPKYNLELIKKDGSLCMAEVTEFPIFNENNEVIAVEGLIQVVN
ncbi:methyl-accepting chemotaxis protein [Natranaerovirga pectinivora]|uniref:Methyl-accepting chemotaxis protein n=1 Tax=Natranaerovirga pectinivora TaxID=682400 RepID=A0A4R3MKL8_9FIRM|nr:methyl-accepting chemotaxis protein [Natranaerovirga pectinivora]TCT12972.1 methyl-accepting chemotaxis protein [Natranaerovirga pectinivora]